MKILAIVGTRPEAIKMAPVIKELEKYPEDIVARVCVTAQHREMLDQVLSLFNIKPNYDLDLMRPNQTLAQLTAHLLTELSLIINEFKPDWLLVQGDTTTVMASSIAAFYIGVQVGHIEAGLRTGNKKQPFPEEINRRIASVIADLHFAPTEWARNNLLQEGISPELIKVTGNTVIDALQIVISKPYDLMAGPLKYIPWDKRIILVTTHRRENFGQPLEDICFALKEIAEQYEDDVQIVYPVHLNPNVQDPVYRLLKDVSNITLLPPLDYLPLVHLMKKSYFIITDSGGIQEEAPGLGKPVLVLREVTERPEGIIAGTVKLVGTNSGFIIKHVQYLLDNPEEYMMMAKSVNPYGDGRAAKRIVQSFLNISKEN